MSEKTNIENRNEVNEKVKLEVTTEVDSIEFQSSISDSINEDEINGFYSKLSTNSIQYLHELTGHGADLNHGNESSEFPFDLNYFLSKVIKLSDEQLLKEFNELLIKFDDDTNFPSNDLNFIKQINSEPSLIENDFELNFKAKLLTAVIKFHSPYPEVRATTDFTDDPNEKVETIRSYTIGIIWLILSAGIKEFFSHRKPAITLSTAICSVLMYPCGKLWEFVIPKWTINFFGKKLPLNPGPYGFKEQMFATLIVSVASSNVYVSYNIVTQIKFYNQDWVAFGYQVLLVLSTQFMGFSFAGLLRKFVIYPERALWPTILPTLALNRALLKPERKENIHGWTISKFKFFWIIFTFMFCYFWIPDYLFQALSTFNWMNWIAPNNFNLATVVGSSYGLGLFNPITTFDWNYVMGVFDPLSIPFLTVANLTGGAIIGGLIILGVFYSNHKWTGYLPINSNGIYTNTGESFNVSRVLTNGELDNEKYQAYSPPFYTAANIVVYSAFFFVYPFTFLFNSYKEWATIKKSFVIIRQEVTSSLKGFSFKKMFIPDPNGKKAVSSYDDVHSQLMSKYDEVPDIYFAGTLVISLVLAILCVKLYPETLTPVWSIFFVIGINFVFLIPFCLLYAITGIQYGLNVLVELIVGYAINNGMALMTIKALGYNIDGQAENFVSSQKIGHYVKIPPRAFFRAQFIGTFIQAFVFLGVVNWSLSNIEGLCDSDQPQKFTCPNERTYYSASVLWGVIGPKIVFNGLYPIMKYAFLIGFLVALLFIVIKRFTPKLLPKQFEPTVFLTGIINVYAPYNMSYITPAFYVSFAFMYYIKRRFPAWFAKFTYVLSAALNSSIAFSAIIIFFAVQYHAKSVNWWGNSVSSQGVEGGDGQQSLYDITLTSRGYFGPELGNFPTNRG